MIVVRAVAAVAATAATVAQTRESANQRIVLPLPSVTPATVFRRDRRETITLTRGVVPEPFKTCPGALPLAYRNATSERASPAEDGGQRHQENPGVTKDCEVLDVLALDREALAELQVTAPVDLHRAGDPRLHLQPEPVLRQVALDELDLLRPRPDERHLTAEDVDELGKLVEARPPQQPSDASHARVGRELAHRVVELVERDDLLEP